MDISLVSCSSDHQSLLRRLNSGNEPFFILAVLLFKVRASVQSDTMFRGRTRASSAAVVHHLVLSSAGLWAKFQHRPSGWWQGKVAGGGWGPALLSKDMLLCPLLPCAPRPVAAIPASLVLLFPAIGAFPFCHLLETKLSFLNNFFTTAYKTLKLSLPPIIL